MNPFVFAAAFSLVSASVSLAGLLPYNTAVEKAKAENKPIVVLWAGTGWDRGSAEVKAMWDKVASKSSQPVIWALYDERDGLSDEARKKEVKPPFESWNVPMALVVTPDNQKLICVIDRERVKEASKVAAVLPKMLAAYDKLVKADEEAKGKSGKEAAAVYGKALDGLPYQAARTHKDVIEKIRKADPKDESGYVFKYDFHHQNVYKEVNKVMEDGGKKGKDRNFAGAEQWLRNRLASPVLDKEQKQMLNVALAYVARMEYDFGAVPSAKPKMIEAFKTAMAIDPKSELGKGCKNYIAYFTEPVVLKNLDVANGDMRREWTPWVADVSSEIKKPGTYVVKCVKSGGGYEVRNPRLTAKGKTVAMLDASQRDKNQNEFELTVPEGKVPAGLRLEMEGRGSGHWMDGFGRLEIKAK